MGQLRHRGWLVEQNYLGTFEATHPDFDPTPVHLYDGQSDNRAVFAETLEELADEIDAWIDEHEPAPGSNEWLKRSPNFHPGDIA